MIIIMIVIIIIMIIMIIVPAGAAGRILLYLAYFVLQRVQFCIPKNITNYTFVLR